MYRTWVAIALAGLLAGVAVVSLFVGFGSPAFLGVAAASAGGGFLAYRYARERMLESVYAGVGTASARSAVERTADDATDAATGGADGERPDGAVGEGEPHDRRRTAQATDGGETTADYDDWTWADSDPDDPFWSDDPEDWEDPWEWEATDPESAAEGGRRWRGTDAGARDGRGSDRWSGWSGGRYGPDDEREGEGRKRGDGRSGSEGGERGPTVAEAYETLGLEPGADPEAVRRAYRERVKETHPDRGGDPGAFIRVREAYERLCERTDGEER